MEIIRSEKNNNDEQYGPTGLMYNKIGMAFWKWVYFCMFHHFKIQLWIWWRIVNDVVKLQYTQNI